MAPSRVLLLQAEQDIEDRKRELVEARLELAHKQEYETIRKQIMQVRSLFLCFRRVFACSVPGLFQLG